MADEGSNVSIVDYADSITLFSIALSLLVPILVLAIGLHKRQLVDRVSLRLQVAVSIIDFVSGLANYLGSLGWSDASCKFIGYWNFMVTPIYCFLNVAIAVNLQLVFIHGLNPKKYWEYIYWGVTISLTVLISIPLIVLDFFGSDDPLNGICFVKDSFPNGNQLTAVLNAYLIIITLVYCLIITVLVIIKINKGIESLEKHHAFSTENSLKKGLEMERFLKKLISRIALYPVVFVIVNIGLVFNFLGKLIVGERVFALWAWANFSVAFTGLLNFVAFMLDPTFQNALKICYIDFKNRYFNSKPDEIELARKNSSIANFEEGFTQEDFDEEAFEEEALKTTALF